MLIALVVAVVVQDVIGARSVGDGLRLISRPIAHDVIAHDACRNDIPSWLSRFGGSPRPGEDPIVAEFQEAVGNALATRRWSITTRITSTPTLTNDDGSPRPPILRITSYDNGVLEEEHDKLNPKNHGDRVYTADESWVRPPDSSYWASFCGHGEVAGIGEIDGSCSRRTIEGGDVVLRSLAFDDYEAPNDCAEGYSTNKGVLAAMEAHLRDGVFVSYRQQVFGNPGHTSIVVLDRTPGDASTPSWFMIVPDWAKHAFA